MKRLKIDFSVSNQAFEENLKAEEVERENQKNLSAPTEAESKLRLLREERNRLLSKTDWTQGADVPDSIKNAYTSYRQKLRDITKTYSDVRTVEWPEPPTDN